MDKTLETLAKEARDRLLGCEMDARALMQHSFFKNEEARPGQFGEIKANIMLSIRHCEDARMRLGKVCQHAGTGDSSYS